MITHSGERVFPFGHAHYDEAGCPSTEDIARGLSRQARFCGQTDAFYSVLAHSFVVAAIMPPELAFYGLMHDAHEAIMSDVPTTWKEEVRQYHENWLEGHILEIIAPKLGVSAECPAKEQVKLADMAALRAEAHLLGHAAAEEFWPRSSFTELDVSALIKTHEAIAAGISYDMLLDPDLAAEAFNNAVQDYAHVAKTAQSK